MIFKYKHVTQYGTNPPHCLK